MPKSSKFAARSKSRAKQINAALRRVVKEAKEEVSANKLKTLRELTMLCDRMMNELARNKDTGNITGNQVDAFGYAVYSDGQEFSRGFATDKVKMYSGKGEDRHSWQKTPAMGTKKPKDGKEMGRARAKAAIDAHVAKEKGYEVYIVNAMPYSALQQEHQGYRIIAMTISDAFYHMSQRYRKYLNIDFPNRYHG